MNRFIFAALAFGLVACGYSESKYKDDIKQASCQWSFDCFGDLMGWSSVDDCLNLPEDTSVTCTGYNADNAKSCVDAFDGLTCDDDFPSVCADVYDSCTSDSGM